MLILHTNYGFQELFLNLIFRIFIFEQNNVIQYLAVSFHEYWKCIRKTVFSGIFFILTTWLLWHHTQWDKCFIFTWWNSGFYHILVDNIAKILPCYKTLSLFRIIRGIMFISPSFITKLITCHFVNFQKTVEVYDKQIITCHFHIIPFINPRSYIMT
jgi:hypothetical protein